MAIEQYGPLSLAFASGCAGTWGFVMTFIVPKEVKALKAELDLVKAQVDDLRHKAQKYDALNEKLAQGALAKLDG